jgi:PAS domain S-box-containing protein
LPHLRPDTSFGGSVVPFGHWQVNCFPDANKMSADTTIRYLKEAETKYRGMFENAIEGIYQSTPDGRYLAVNAALARMYGYEHPDELLNEVSDIQSQIYVDPAFREKFKRQIELTGFVQGLEYQVRRRDGSIIWISESARVVRNAAGAVHHYEGFIDNITSRKEAEAERAKLERQMLQAQKMDAIGTLASGMAHDFNNILCAILGYTDLALTDQQIKGRTRENLHIVHQIRLSRARPHQPDSHLQPAGRHRAPSAQTGRHPREGGQNPQRHSAFVHFHPR